MKAFLVSSVVTFVPNNYTELVGGLAENPSIQGLILIDNREISIALKGLALLLSGAAPRMGLQLLKNYFSPQVGFKKNLYTARGKKFYLVTDINSEETAKLLRDEKVDLLLNARTRSFFRQTTRTAPRWGCINIHHGLLPEQRGLMCDFWAHLYQTRCGFSIHQMTTKLDDGPILKVVEVPTDRTNYMESIALAARLEVSAASEVLEKIAAAQAIVGTSNIQNSETVYRNNPKLLDFYKLHFRGTRI